MKGYKRSAVVILVLLSVILLAAPVQAAPARWESRVTSFTFRLTDVQFELYRVGQTSPVQGVYALAGTVVSSEGRVSGKLSCPALGKDASPFAGGVIPATWVPAPTAWRLETSASGVLRSGWAGTATFYPWTRPARWPGAVMAYYSGEGFGANRGLHIEWSVYHPTQIPAQEYVFSGLITSN